MTDEARFWRHVPNRPDGCWEWDGGRNKGGYGLLGEYVAPNTRWKLTLAHRVSWVLHNGPIPEGLVVCHRCDNPPCVNPTHLFLGTQGDNLRDAGAKGRLNHWIRRSGPDDECIHGHKFDAANTYIKPNGWRICRTCKRRRDRDSRRVSKPTAV